MKKQLRKPVLLLLTVAILAAATGGYYLSKDNNPEQRYKLQIVEKGELNQSVSANGTLNPVILVNVGTQVSGTVKKLYVDFNSKVAQGQILMELDDALFSAQVKQSQANVASAAATLDLADANEARARTFCPGIHLSARPGHQRASQKSGTGSTTDKPRAAGQR